MKKKYFIINFLGIPKTPSRILRIRAPIRHYDVVHNI